MDNYRRTTRYLLENARVRTNYEGVGNRPFGPLLPSFEDALQVASVDDLQWALKVLTRDRHARRSYTYHRKKRIAEKLKRLLDDATSIST